MFLPGQMLEFGDASEWIIIGIIDYSDRLELGLVERFMFEFEAAVRKFAEPEIEELIHRTGINNLAARDRILDVAIVRVEQNPDIRMIEHVGKHPRETMFGHGLINIGE